MFHSLISSACFFGRGVWLRFSILGLRRLRWRSDWNPKMGTFQLMRLLHPSACTYIILIVHHHTYIYITIHIYTQYILILIYYPSVSCALLALLIADRLVVWMFVRVACQIQLVFGYPVDDMTPSGDTDMELLQHVCSGLFPFIFSGSLLSFCSYINRIWFIFT